MRSLAATTFERSFDAASIRSIRAQGCHEVLGIKTMASAIPPRMYVESATQLR